MTKHSGRSDRQSEASRANGAKSRGPKTSSGKANSAKNATLHGLTSSQLKPSPAEKDEIEALRAKLNARFNPKNDQKSDLIDRVILASLRLRRARALINETIEDIAVPSNPRRKKTLQARQAYIQERILMIQSLPGNITPSQRVMNMLAEQAGHLPVTTHPRRGGLEKLMRYARRFRGERDRALNRLEALNA